MCCNFVILIFLLLNSPKMRLYCYISNDILWKHKYFEIRLCIFSTLFNILWLRFQCVNRIAIAHYKNEDLFVCNFLYQTLEVSLKQFEFVFRCTHLKISKKYFDIPTAGTTIDKWKFFSNFFEWGNRKQVHLSKFYCTENLMLYLKIQTVFLYYHSRNPHKVRLITR